MSATAGNSAATAGRISRATGAADGIGAEGRRSAPAPWWGAATADRASRSGTPVKPPLREQRRVGAQGGLPAEVRVEHRRVARDLAARDEVDHSGHRLPLVDGVGDHALEAAGEPDRLERLLVRDAVRTRVVALVEEDLVVVQV